MAGWRVNVASSLVALACLAGPARAQFDDDPPTFVSDFCKRAAATKVDDKELKTKVKDGMLAFSLGLYQAQARTPGINLISSPASVDLALAMTLAGARGETEAELAKVLGLPPAADRDKLYRSLVGQMTCPNGAQRRVFSIANGLFVQKGKELLAPFKSLVKDDFDARLSPLEFRKAPEAARAEINDWVAKATLGKINDLIPAHTLSKDTRVVLADAVYLKDAWARPFEKKETKDGPFHTDAKTTVQAPLMHRVGEYHDFMFAGFPGFKAVGMQSHDFETLVVFFVPNDVTGLAAVEKSLTPQLIEQMHGKLRARRVDFTLPRFKVEQAASLRDLLIGLGAKQLFEAKANFNGIDGGADKLYIGDVLHKAYVEVNETGIEAAAATAVVALAGGMPPPPEKPVVVKADHPFAFLVFDARTQVLLFTGRVTDPTVK